MTGGPRRIPREALRYASQSRTAAGPCSESRVERAAVPGSSSRSGASSGMRSHGDSAAARVAQSRVHGRRLLSTRMKIWRVVTGASQRNERRAAAACARATSASQAARSRSPPPWNGSISDGGRDARPAR